MANIFGPHFANNTDQYTRLQVPKLHYQKGTARKDLYYSKLDDLEYLGQGFHQVWYQGIVKATGSGALEDLTFKISEGSDQN